MESIRLDALSGRLNSWLEADAAERERLSARLAASGELGGRPDGLDLCLLNEVDAQLGSRDAFARTGGVRAVDEELILIGAEPNAVTVLVVPLAGEVDDTPGTALMR